MISAIVASYNARPFLERCLSALDGSVDEVIVVDAASTDGSAELVAEQFPDAHLLVLDANRGFGNSINVGVSRARGDHLLVLNPDAWPLGDGIARLAAVLDSDPLTAVVGPRLTNSDGTLQQSVRGYPTLWRLATEYFFLRWLAPRSRALNAFYAAGFDHRSMRTAEFLVGAALLVRRSAFEEAGGFDTTFFMFNEEVDLCYRLTRRGWNVVFCPDAEFVHVGGASTRPDWERMYREQLRSHLRFLAKHRGPDAAERARRMLVWAMRLRGHVFRGERRAISRTAARWLASASASDLIAPPPRTP